MGKEVRCEFSEANEVSEATYLPRLGAAQRECEEARPGEERVISKVQRPQDIVCVHLQRQHRIEELSLGGRARERTVPCCLVAFARCVARSGGSGTARAHHLGDFDREASLRVEREEHALVLGHGHVAGAGREGGYDLEGRCGEAGRGGEVARWEGHSTCEGAR